MRNHGTQDIIFGVDALRTVISNPYTTIPHHSVASLRLPPGAVVDKVNDQMWYQIMVALFSSLPLYTFFFPITTIHLFSLVQQKYMLTSFSFCPNPCQSSPWYPWEGLVGKVGVSHLC